MKRISSLMVVILITAMLSCNKRLIEEPRSVLVPAGINTSQGFQMALDAAYAGTRLFWGNQDLLTITVIGTDEFQRGVDGNSDINVYSSSYTPSHGTVNANWRNAYTFINTCNAVIDNAEKVDLPKATKDRMVAEAKFLRANYYFILVQFFGDVTLNKSFQASATTSASRTPKADVYNFIIQDLKDAIALLPAGPKSSGVLPGKASAAAAQHVLAKVYLTRAGSAARQAGDYQDAYNNATELINKTASLQLALLPDFSKVFAEGNEENSEVLWTVQHTSNIAFNGPNNSGVSNFSADNVLNHMWVGQYERRPGMVRDVFYGRPYIRCIPTRWLTDTAFREKIKDTRYHNTFQTVWYANNPDPKGYPVWPSTLPAGAPAGAVPGQPKFKLGDTAIFMPGYDVSDAQIAASRYLLIPPRKYDNTLAPTMTKYFDTKRADLNSPSIRPVIVYRLAETYLVAAEAAFMLGKATDAAAFVNVIRDRAASAGSVNRITAADLSIDFMLDERSRELCGENMRWWDLVRTNKLLERVRLHNPEARPNIQQKHVLRPIPQAQIDATTTGDPYTQNPDW
ncbi:RagB/SusD family nutrient uptake outer membrane protein [Segetibacter sp. 3557_3]|uniref:RagB/SusD family nutrient uptake outer membrane protein n=1 Tax=Segetibacter sp. 3557_3 TaxID=2547429 RepID=UPI0010591E32|nr:RagB/SusD family nutrient uptake outer membrane protein [Segetibacter sp. 3557_3]TDH20068.1 RagB/SusD family nutrient uptake outer membrane protein [Segetibacter sp. 3557_3]